MATPSPKILQAGYAPSSKKSFRILPPAGKIWMFHHIKASDSTASNIYFNLLQDKYVVTLNTNDWIDWYYLSNKSAQIPAGTYIAGLNKTTPGSLCKAIYDAMYALDVNVTDVTFSTITKKFTITFSTDTYIKWQSGTHGSSGTDTHIGDLIGFLDNANTPSAFSHTSNYPIPYIQIKTVAGTSLIWQETAVENIKRLIVDNNYFLEIVTDSVGGTVFYEYYASEIVE